MFLRQISEKVKVPTYERSKLKSFTRGAFSFFIVKISQF